MKEIINTAWFKIIMYLCLFVVMTLTFYGFYALVEGKQVIEFWEKYLLKSAFISLFSLFPSIGFFRKYLFKKKSSEI